MRDSYVEARESTKGSVHEKATQIKLRRPAADAGMKEKLRHTATAFQRDMDDVPSIESTQDGILGTLRRREVLFWRRWSLCRGRCWSFERDDVSHMEIIEQYAAMV